MSIDAVAMTPPDNPNLPHHEFKGRLDRWCEVPGCNRPDRNPIHHWPTYLPEDWNGSVDQATEARERSRVAPSVTFTAQPTTSESDLAPAPAADESSASSARGSVSRATASPTPDEPRAIETAFAATPPATPRSDDAGSPPTSTEPSSGGTPRSGTSGPPSRPSKRRWPIPKNAMEFASQARMVMTMYLNGEMDREEVQTYSAVARTVAQALSTEVTRARAERGIPELSFGDIEFEDPE